MQSTPAYAAQVESCKLCASSCNYPCTAHCHTQYINGCTQTHSQFTRFICISCASDVTSWEFPSGNYNSLRADPFKGCIEVNQHNLDLLLTLLCTLQCMRNASARGSGVLSLKSTGPAMLLSVTGVPVAKCALKYAKMLSWKPYHAY